MHHAIGEQLPIWSVIPFIGMLCSIAVFPLIRPEWWEHHRLKVSIGWSLLFLIPFGIAWGGHMLAYQFLEMILLDYLPFIILLFGLFVAAGGIVLKGTLVGSTKVNLIMLLIGTAMASWVGTTGAAMLLIRPLIRANSWRKRKTHVVVFFIFLVANMGGCLTPIGDPPLFLGFLRGVPFFWTMRLLPLLLFNTAIVSLIFVVLDRYFYRKDVAEGYSPTQMTANHLTKEPLRLEGAHNLIFIAMIVGAVILNGTLAGMPTMLDADGTVKGFYLFDDIKITINYVLQLAIILLAAFLSLKTTQSSTRELNCFTFEPIKEVAGLFVGIFLTMIPALALLRAHGGGLGLDQSWQLFWVSGGLSSFLDNAPTYLVFMTLAASLGSTVGVETTVGVVAATHLLAVSAGAVFMGANTYIGNAPNFMVKSIAEENAVKMPSFVGYMAWSLPILLPVFLLDTLLFL